MRLMIYNHHDESTRLKRIGVLVNDHLVGDLRAAYARYLVEKAGNNIGREIAALCFPSTITDFLRIGPAAWEMAALTLNCLTEWAHSDVTATGLDDERLLIRLGDCQLHAPVLPGKLIMAGRNYANHLKERGHAPPMRVPTSWIKANSAVIGPTHDICRPAVEKRLDYETELALVIGRKCKNVPEHEAYDVIAGYLILNDVTARDILKVEHEEGNKLLGKMSDTFAPTGPWLVSKNEIPDPMNLRIVTRVNGKIRQDSSTRNMIWSIPKLIAYLSQMTIEAGDIIATGSPEGVAGGRKPGETPWWLSPGDILESEIENIGVLRNRIIDDSTPGKQWTWNL
ncbi:MAG: fumarylacetoacetate hydrolase family protein [Betaproteobacteria bacterium]|nr:fumarylacetoacetate hydrolase family protein [Betaproteobacteria bacterium]